MRQPFTSQIVANLAPPGEGFVKMVLRRTWNEHPELQMRIVSMDDSLKKLLFELFGFMNFY